MYKLTEKTVKWIFLKKISITANQTISGNSVNRHVWFGSITSSGKGYNRYCTVWFLIGKNFNCKYCVWH